MMDAMAAVEIPYVQAFTDRHGHARHYYRRRGYPRAALPDPASPAFSAAYEAAGRLAEPSQGIGSERTEPGSISALIAAYYLTADWRDLKPSTKRAHRSLLDRFRAKHGTKRVRTIEPRHLKAIFDTMALETPGAAVNLRKRLRVVFQLGVDLGWRETNPARETKAPKHKTKGFTPWSEEDIAAYEKRWPSGSRERRAMALLLYTGQRRSDVVTMGRQHLKGGRVYVVPQKTQDTSGARLAIRVHPELQRELDAVPAGDMTFILTQYGEPFSNNSFGSWFRERAEMAGVMGRTAHGLRKAAGRRLAEAGCTAKQIMAVLGHTTLSQAEIYIRDADQMHLADQAMDKLGGVS